MASSCAPDRRRLRPRHAPAILLLGLVAACAAGEPTGVTSVVMGDDDGVGVLISPRNVTLEHSQPIHFAAYESALPGSSLVTAIEWTATGGSIGTDGSYSASGSGEFRVIGKRRGNPHNRPDTSVVVVVPPQPTVTGVEVTPSNPSLLRGTQGYFSATGSLSDGSMVPIGVTWTATGGTIDAGGMYTAGTTAGTYRVIAQHYSTGLADTVPVTVTAPSLVSVQLSPASASLAAGGTVQFALTARWSDGSQGPVPAAFSATGGTISTMGYYTAGSTAGTYRVIATNGGLADTSAVTIAASAPAAPSPTLAGGQWLNEEFRYSSTQQYWSNPYGWLYKPYQVDWWHPERISIDAVNTYNGHPTLRYDWPANTGCGGTPGEDYQITSSYRPPAQREMWVEVAHKFASTFDADPAHCGGGGGYKFMLFWRTAGDRYDMVSAHSWHGANPQTPASPLQPTSDGENYGCSGLDGHCVLGYPNGTWATSLGLIDQAPYLPNRPGTLWDGQWHVWRFHLRISSSPTTRDGIYRIWLDGRMVVNRLNFASVSAWNGNVYSQIWEYIALGGNSNSGVAQATSNWWGHLKIYTSNPGW